jgi:outer membrane receptor protein involved in Fe transport
MRKRSFAYRHWLLASSALFLCAPVLSGTAFAQTTAAAEDAEDEIVVFGTTSRRRSFITSSVDATSASAEDIVRLAPNSLADTLELVPGVFVEGTAGAVSNNYSVRGLQGGAQRFIALEEDGLPIVYRGGGADEFFAHDITIDGLEAIRGGTSGILSVNGAAAAINFIPRTPNFETSEAIARLTVESYGERRADFYYSAPLSSDLAFNVGGYVSSSPGVRDNPFTYDTYHIRASLERQFTGGYVRLTAKVGDQHDAYYATYPHTFLNGEPGSVPGFDQSFDNIGGTAFGRIDVPVSTFVSPSGFRTFALSEGIHAETSQIRLDFERRLSDEFDVFAHVRYLDLAWDFNGLFPGSGVGNAGLTSAVNYLTPGPNSPINGLLTAGQAAFPSTVRFGFRNLTTGVVTPSTDTATLNALNGNGLMQQTWLNHDQQEGTDFGSNFGGRWEHEGVGFANSLTVGLMYYDESRSQNQAGTAHVINDVRNDSRIYDVVALDASNNVIGTLTNNGLVTYGEWGVGINTTDTQSLSVYANDELRIGDNLHLDFGVRHETLDVTRRDGNAAAVNQPVPPGTGGLTQNVGSTWDGTYSTREASWDRTAWTVGANYLFTPDLAVYVRYAKGFQTLGVDEPVDVILYEAGVRYQGERLTASATVFRTEFDNQFYGFIDPINPAVQGAFLADLSTDGFEVNVTYSPIDDFVIDAVGVFQNPELSNVFINNVATPSFEGNRPERTPETLFTITPRYTIFNGLAEVYGRYKFVGDIFADAGNGLALPEYGVTSVGVIIDPTERLRITLNADNIFDEIGLTEGNPRQGQTQSASSGLFYGRGIVGTTYTASVTFKF